MTRMSTIVRLFAALLFAMIALPGGAATQNKWFYPIFPADLADVNSTLAGVQIDVKIVNDSEPPGFSTINSLKIIAPVGVTIDAVVSPSASLSGPTDLPDGRKAYIIASFPGIKRGGFQVFQFTITPPGAPCKAATWEAFANTGNSYPGGDEFSLRANHPLLNLTSYAGCTGAELKCPSIPFAPGITSFTDSTHPTDLLRWENKDGSVCVPVSFSLMFPTTYSLSLTWDTASQPYATIEVQTTWPYELTDPVTQLPRRTKVDWIVTPPTLVEAPTCLSARPPAVIGTLAAPITTTPAAGTEETIKVTAASLPAAPFAIVVPSNSSFDPERMLVKSHGPSATPGVLDVVVLRGSGVTAISQHSTGAKVNSTPLPVFGASHPVLPNQQANACIFYEEFTTPLDPSLCPAQTANQEPRGCFQAITHMFVIGDPVISREP